MLQGDQEIHWDPGSAVSELRTHSRDLRNCGEGIYGFPESSPKLLKMRNHKLMNSFILKGELESQCCGGKVAD